MGATEAYYELIRNLIKNLIQKEINRVAWRVVFHQHCVEPFIFSFLKFTSRLTENCLECCVGFHTNGLCHCTVNEKRKKGEHAHLQPGSKRTTNKPTHTA